MEFYVAQGISILTALVAVLMMQFKKMSHILAGQILANLLTASTYFLLGGFSGAGICFIAIAQSVVMFFYAKRQKKPHLWVVIGFMALYVACSAYYYASPIDICSAMAAVCFAVSIVQQKPAASRFWYALNPLCWLIYDLFTKAYGNFAMHVVIFISTALAFVRLDLCRKPSKQSPPSDS
jgi:hypothetical protein